MIKDIFEEKGLSVYKVSKETNISYSTLNDIVIEKTDIKKTSSECLYRLAKYLDMTMESLYMINDNVIQTIYIHNIGRNIVVESKDFRHQYLGPKNLVSLRQINKVESHVVYVDMVFRDSPSGFVAEEDYIDLMDVLDQDSPMLNSPYHVHIGSVAGITKSELIDRSMMVSDNMAISLYFIPGTNIPALEVRNLARTNNRMIIRYEDLSILESNMSVSMQTRAINAVMRNQELIDLESKKVGA